MKCKHCGAEIPEWMDFCPECAKSVNDPVPEADAPAGEAAPVKAEEELKKAATVEFDDEEEEELVIASVWDFLHDNGGIYKKRVMSPAEVSGCSLILEQVFCCLAQ